MEYKKFGNSGLRVSAMGLGCNPFGNEVNPETAEAIVNKAIDAGITYFDTADTYFAGRSEDYLGRALVGKRHNVIIATKFGNRSGPGPNDTGGSRQHIFESVEGSLRRLQTDYIDVYQMHSADRETPIEETMEALNDLVRAGKVRYIGCSNFYDWEVVEAQWVAKSRNFTQFSSAQDFYNLLYRDVEKRFVPMAQKYGLAMIPYFPLAGALLSGAYKRGVAPEAGSRGAIRPTFKTWDSERNWDVQENLSKFAQDRGWTLPQMSIAWMISRPQMATVIAGADQPWHVEENVKAVDLKLSAEDLAELDRITLVEEDRTIAPIYRARG